MSLYVFEGTLRAYISVRCWDVVRGATIRLYRHRDDQKVDDLVSARTKHTFTVLTEKQIDDKSGSLIAEATSDDDGAFRFELGERQKYEGGAFEVDVRLTGLKGVDAGKSHGPIQFTVTSLQPAWKQEGDVMVAEPWQHYIAARYWCYILALFDLWVVCGTVVAIGTQTPLSAMTVRAYDRDWIQDDLLGQDVTDNNGAFYIYYTSATFKKTPFSPFINLEMTSGPDVYFDVEDSGGTLLLDERPSEGRKPGRENVGHCFCVTLEAGEEAPPYTDPLFDHVGNFHILYDIDATGLANKSQDSAGGAGWGFFGHVKMKGFCPKKKPGTNQPMFYRFRYVDPTTSAVKNVTGDLLTKVFVGSKLVWWDVDADGVFGWTSQSIRVAGSGATAPVSGGTGPVPDHIIEPDGDGWIAVDQDALDDGITTLIRLNTHKIVPGGSAPGSGASNPPADPKNGAKVDLIFETTTDKVTIDTQTDTVTLLVNNWVEVRQLDLDEFVTGSAGACTGLTTKLTILYTVDHELIDEWEVLMSSAASGWSQPAGLPQGSTPRGDAGTHPVIDITTWPPCSYTVKLRGRRALTDGENNDDFDTLPVTFCKT